MDKDLVSDWLERAEQLAGLPKQSGTLSHAFRLQMIYQQADPETVYRVVSEPAELREVQA